MSRRHSTTLRVVSVATALLVGGLGIAGCGAENKSLLPGPNQLEFPTTTTTDSTAPTTTTTSAPPSSSVPGSKPGNTPKAPPAPQPGGGGRCAGFPSSACTGVPAGTQFKVHNGDLFVTTPGTVLDGLHITGSLQIRAPGVTVRNSQIDGAVLNYDDNKDIDGAYPFTIVDSTIGTDTCKSTETAIGTGNFTAERVRIRGFGDAVRASAPNVVVRDSFLKMCTNDPSTHADGIQDYPASGNVVFDHNTVDLCGGRVPTDGHCDLTFGYNSPVFLHSNTNGGTKGARITNNLIMGGVYSIFLWPQPGAPWIVTGNRVVNGTWTYGPAHTEGLCGQIDQWSDNTAVRIDANYKITATVGPITCPN